MDWESIRPLLPGLAMLVVMIFIFWLVIVRPTRKSQQEHLDLISSIVPGDRIITVGGIHGKILRVHENSFELEVARDIVMTFDRRAVRKLQEDE